MRLMRPEEEKNATVRSSALWGKGGRGLLSSLAVVVALAAPTAALAEEGSGSSGSASFKAYTSPGLLNSARLAPGKTFDVIVDGTHGQVDRRRRSGSEEGRWLTFRARAWACAFATR